MSGVEAKANSLISNPDTKPCGPLEAERPAATAAVAPKTPLLPPLGRLAAVGAAVNAPVFAVCLLTGNPKAGISLLAGYVLALTIYGMLYAIVGRALDFFGPESGERPSSSTNMMSTLGFVALMIGKYVVVGIFLYLVWRTGYLVILPVLSGFLLAQIAITWQCVAHSKKTVLGGRRF